MKFLLLLSVIGVVGIAVLALVQPNARNLNAIKIGAVAAVLAGAGALLWPEQAAAIGVGTLVLAVLWVAGRVLLWPFRAFAALIRGDR